VHAKDMATAAVQACKSKPTATDMSTAAMPACRSEPATTAWRLLRRNPELLKAMVAAGMQRGAFSVFMAMVVSELRPMIWGEKTAENVATMSMLLSILAVSTSGAFGRFGDCAGRRTAALVMGVLHFMPGWILLPLGFNERGLFVSSAAFVLSGIGMSSDVLLVLANDVTRPEDRSYAFGIFQATVNGLAFVLFGIPAFFVTMLKVVKNPGPEFWLLYATVLSIGYFIAILTICVPGQAAAAKCSSETAPQSVSPPDVEKVDSCSSVAAASAAVANLTDSSLLGSMQQALRAVLSPMLMVWQHAPMRRLWFCGVLLAFSGDLVFDIGSQFFREELGILVGGTYEQNQLVSVLTMLPPTILMIPASLLVGLLAQRFGSLPLLKALVPMSALMVAMGALMALFPYYWAVPLVCLAQNFASLAGNVPLKFLVADLAPEGREGEAMGALGMGLQVTSLLANAGVKVVTPILYQYLEKPLWIYYVACGAMTLLGAIPLCGFVLEAAALDKYECTKDESGANGAAEADAHIIGSGAV